jgi:outer membrane protein OmpA-like peptidoglycan-associated protein
MNQIVSNPIDTTTNQLKVIKPDLQQPKKNAKIPKKTSVTLNSEVEISEKSNYELLKEKFKNYNATIYFENNSTDITDEITVKTLDSMIAILNQNNQIDIYLQGFASNTGSKTYNDKISLRRTLQIKNHLIRNGIAPERILSFNPGIDTNAKTPAEARRVSVSLLIRK